MNTKIFTILILLFSIHLLNSQSVEVGGNYSLKLNATIHAITTDSKGNIYAAGDFKNGMARNYVVKYDGNKWSEVVGSTVLFAKDRINTIATDNSGNIYVGGNYKDALFNRDYIVSKYDGKNWATFAGFDTLKANGSINCILSDTKGNVYVGGQFKNSNNYSYIAMFDGTKWTELGGKNSLEQNSTSSNSPEEMCFDNSGNLYVVGISLGFHKYDGSKWIYIKADTSVCCIPNTIAVDSKNNVYIPGGVIGNFGKYNVVKYDGTKWTELGGTKSLISFGHISKIFCDKNDNIYATVIDSNSKYFIAKFDGSKWIKYSISYKSNDGFGLRKICSGSNGEIYTAGGIGNDSQYRYIAKLQNTTNQIQIVNSNQTYISPNPCSSCELITPKQIDADDYAVINILGKQVNASFDKSTNGYRIILPEESRGIYFLQNTQSGEVMRFMKE